MRAPPEAGIAGRRVGVPRAVPPRDRPSRTSVNPPTFDRRANPALCGKSTPSRNVVVDVQGRGRMTCLSGADRPPHPVFGTRNRAATAAGASAPELGRPPPLPPIPVQRRTRDGPACVPVPRTRVERGTVASGGDRRTVTSAMPYVRCIRCGVRCFSAARWSNVDQCGVCGADLPRRPVDSRAAVARVHPAPTASLVLAATVPHGREVADTAWGGAGAPDRAITRRVAARTARSA
jgi:hypothetical protein